MNVLLFDLSPSFRALFQSAISEHIEINWYEFDGINNEAIATLSSEMVHAIVTAKELNNGSYLDVLGACKDSKLNSASPVFLLSSDSSDDFIKKALNQGVIDVYSKKDILGVVDIFTQIIRFVAQAEGSKILYFSGAKSSRDIYAESLRKFGFELVETNDIKMAHMALANGDLELILVNIENRVGLQEIRLLRRDVNWRRDEIPIMVLSEKLLNTHQTGLFYLGIDEYLIKPLAPHQVGLRAIHSVQNFRAQQVVREQLRFFQQAASFDNLTRIFNRKGFLDNANSRIEEAKSASCDIGIAFIDLDKFKPANDTYGHQTGDAILVLIANKLKHVIGKRDLVARWGGDEFVILNFSATEVSLLALGETIQTTMEAEKENLYGVGCSVGIAKGSISTIEELEALIHQADQALYQAKKNGRGQTASFAELT